MAEAQCAVAVVPERGEPRLRLSPSAVILATWSPKMYHEHNDTPANCFEALSGERAGQFSIRINVRWRLCFTFKDGDAFDVEITDYH